MVIPIKNMVANIRIKIRLKIVIMNVGQHCMNFPTYFFKHLWHMAHGKLIDSCAKYHTNSFRIRKLSESMNSTEKCIYDEISSKYIMSEQRKSVTFCAKFGTRWHTCATPCAKIALKPIFAQKRVTSSQTSNDGVFRIEFERISTQFTYS